MTRRALSLAVVGILISTAAKANDEQAIRELGVSYVEAFNRGDAKAVASFWSPEAVYTNRVTGEQVTGRDAIADQFEALIGESRGIVLEISVVSIQFVSPNVAVEQGLARFLSPDSTPEEVDYSAVYVRRGGKWLLDRVTDNPIPVVQSNYQHLKNLEWMIGGWVDEDDNARIVTECNWTKNQNFITRSFTVSIADRIDTSGMQIVGWDPVAKEIRSWTFDSHGGFTEGKWSHKGDRWFVHKSGVLQDGGQATAVNIIEMIDENTFTVQSVSRTVDGELLPNVDEVRVVRQ